MENLAYIFMVNRQMLDRVANWLEITPTPYLGVSWRQLGVSASINREKQQDCYISMDSFGITVRPRQSLQSLQSLQSSLTLWK
jgi:hypothetical protein